MHNMLGLVKWVLICALWLVWLGLILANRATVVPFVVIPGAVVVEKLPMAILLFASLAILFCLFWIVGVLDQLDAILEARSLRKRISELENEVRQLRNLPIREGQRTERALEGENA